ncbi:hypothetical protein FNF29_03246 [Cafeteria roenbergensis]|uniref:Methyltransferase domain-containing protein n=1 Tax=Cafeteria roenbergensis TaxID=33653 RepID=A0A5A8CL16_CAFRO|nr:hypothetical protein FNF29_03246 [Cafeteria roenbergensis]|eukprot:KAA0153429.1 hypothetical protein FNF29_03246 [Cafeteria roenbergensis]
MASGMADASGLLPSSQESFRKKAYWDDFFARRGTKAFEWYGAWEDIRDAMLAAIPSGRPVLVTGCGNSTLSEELFGAGLTDIVSMDYSEGVIESMRRKTADRPEMKWEVGDARATGLDAGSVGSVVDKGTLDAVLPEPLADAAADAAALLSEGGRVLEAGGVYVCVSLLQSQVLQCLAATFAGRAWEVTVAPFQPREQSMLCPFIVVVRKAAADAATTPAPDVVAAVLAGAAGAPAAAPTSPGSSSAASGPEASAPSIVLENWRFLDSAVPAPAPVASATQAGEAVASSGALQVLVHAAGVRHRTKQLLQTTKAGQALSMDLFDSRPEAAAEATRSSARFTLFAVDASEQRTCCALVVPRGREAEWTFGTDEGRASLAAQTGMGRLLVVRCNRGHSFGDEAAVRAEVEGAVAAAAPADLAGPIAWMGVASEDDVVLTVAEVTSPLSGAMTIEDVPDPDSETASSAKAKASGRAAAAAAAGAETSTEEDALGYPRLRRLVFFSNQAAVQSEARITGPLRAKKRRRGGAAHKDTDDASSPTETVATLPLAGVAGILQPTTLPPAESGVTVPAVDFSHLPFEYHQAVLACLALPAAQAGARAVRLAALGDGAAAGPSSGPPGTSHPGCMRVCVLGLGGGGLAMFLARGLGGGRVPTLPAAPAGQPPAGPLDPYGCVPRDGRAGSGAAPVRCVAPPARVHCVELDETVAAVARDYFGFLPDNDDGRCVLTVGDGVAHIRARAEACAAERGAEGAAGAPWELTSAWGLDAIVVDVDAKDLSSGLSFPPKVFVDSAFLADAKACLRPGGCVVINIACRVASVLDSILEQVSDRFDWAMQVTIGDGTLNRLVVAGTVPATDPEGSPLLPIPDGPVALGDAVEAWTSPSVPDSRVPCTTRGAAPCSFAGFAVGEIVEWATKLRWIKRPAASALSAVAKRPTTSAAKRAKPKGKGKPSGKPRKGKRKQ